MSNFKFDHKAFDEFQKKLQALEKDTDKFYEDCAKELAARLLRLVIPKTHIGKHENEPGINGGTLRRGWTGGKKQSAKAFAESLDVKKSGKTYTITVINNTPYAAYVEYGHRQTPGRYVPAIGKRLKKGFVPGQRMLQISEQELQSIAPGVLQRKMNKFLKEAFNG